MIAVRSRISGGWAKLSPNHRGALWMITASLGFTVSSALVKSLTAGGLDVFQIAFARALFSFALVLPFLLRAGPRALHTRHPGLHGIRSEEHTSELQSLMRISYAVFCLK